MKSKIEEIEINGITYVPKSEKQDARSLDGLPIVMVRTYSAGVFYGSLVERNGKEVKLYNARRVWYWDGAASLSQLAEQGTSKPENCKFPVAVKEVILTEAIEIIFMTTEAVESLNSVKLWKQ